MPNNLRDKLHKEKQFSKDEIGHFPNKAFH